MGRKFPPPLRESGRDVLGKKEPRLGGSQSPRPSAWSIQEVHKSFELNPELDALLSASK